MNLLIYLYYYRNEFICLDTNLNLLYKGSTIDTISKAQIKIVEIRSEKISTFAERPLIVNRKSCISRGWLFVNSGLKANNEERQSFDQLAVIDLYSLIDGTYQFSFYMPDPITKKMRDFIVVEKTLIALYDNYIAAYDLNF